MNHKPSLRARIARFVVRHVVGRQFRKAGSSIADWRQLDQMAIKHQHLPKGTDIEPVQIAEGLKGEQVSTPGVRTDRAILYLHGGGFVMGSPATHREIAARFSVATDATVLLPAYRLAPEHPFPASLRDSIKAYDWLLTQGLSRERIAIGGDSAGGTLTLQTLITLRDEGGQLPAVAFLLSAVTDWVHFDGESYETRAAVDPLVTLEANRMLASHYIADHDHTDLLLCPMRADLTGLPPLSIHVGDHEVLLSDSVRLAENARASGVEVELAVWPGMWHAFQVGAAGLPEGMQSIAKVSHFVTARLT